MDVQTGSSFTKCRTKFAAKLQIANGVQTRRKYCSARRSVQICASSLCHSTATPLWNAVYAGFSRACEIEKLQYQP